MPDTKKPMDELLWIMQQLRDPETGCPWDIQQNFSTIAPYTIEEAYEVADVIERQAWDELPDELGDLLLQVVFHAQMATEKGWFSFNDVASAINQKMIRRHPHVFGEDTSMTAEEQTAKWEQLKQQERDDKGLTSVLDDVPPGLPELSRSVKLQKRAARVGFDWEKPDDVLEKLDEELNELADARATQDSAAIQDELGDVLFVLTNLARKLKIDPAAALRAANQKFERRFRLMEASVDHDSSRLDAMSLTELEDLWQQAKRSESC